MDRGRLRQIAERFASLGPAQRTLALRGEAVMLGAALETGGLRYGPRLQQKPVESFLRQVRITTPTSQLVLL